MYVSFLGLNQSFFSLMTTKQGCLLDLQLRPFNYQFLWIWSTRSDFLSSKANNKLRALARATLYMSVEKKKILINSFFNAQFNYCPLVWMLHSRRNNNIIRNLHERCLRLVYNDKNSSYEELLTKDGSVSIHHGNIQALATEFYKIKNGLSSVLFTETFANETEFHYNLRRCNDFRIPSIRTVYHGSESIFFF